MKGKPIILFTLLTIAIATVLVFAASKPSASDAPAPADKGITERPLAPEWQLADPDGKTIQSSDFKGRVVILDFWATWCGPCRMEIPGFIELQTQYADEDLTVIGVSLDQDGTKTVKQFMEKQGVNYPIVMGNETVVSAFGDVEAIPTTFIIDREGRVVRKHVGFTSKSEFESDIKSLLDH